VHRPRVRCLGCGRGADVAGRACVAHSAESSRGYHRAMSDSPTDLPSTPALQAIASAGVAHRIVRTERASSAEESARFQGIETHQLLRTIVVRRAEDDYLFVLVPAGRQIGRA